MTKYYEIFDFGGNLHLVMYLSDKSQKDEIEDAVSSFLDSDFDEDLDYEDIISQIMDSFNVQWLIEGCGVVRID